jgi:transposase
VVFTAFDNWRQMACYAGVAPFEYTSGTSIRGKTKVNHLADKTMKSMLQMCVLSAIKYDNQIKLYFEKKKTEGKNPMLVMNNIRCKLLARAFAVINRGTPFVKISNYAA